MSSPRISKRARAVMLGAIVTLASVLAPATAHAISAVGNFTATAGAGQVQLAWNNPADADLDHVNVYRATSRYGTPTLVQAVAAPATTWTDVTAVNGTDYWYTARAATASEVEAPEAVSGGVLSSWYTSTAMTTLAGQRMDATIDYPSSSAANPFGQATTFGVRWDGYVHVPTSETYTFYSDHDDTHWFSIDDVQVMTQTCCAEQSVAVSLSAGWHKLSVTVHQASGSWRERVSWSTPTMPKEIVPSNRLGIERRVQATPRNATVALTSPNGGGTVTGQAAVTFTRTGAVDHFEVDLSTDSGTTWTPLTGHVPGASTTWSWEPPVDTTSTTNRIRVRAVSPGGVTMASDSSDSDFAINTPPAPPISNLTAVGGVGQVVLSWSNPVAANFDHVQVLRSTQEGDPGVVVHTTAGPAVNTWTDASVANGTRYFYRVRSVTPSGVTGPTIAPGAFTGSYYVENGSTEFNELVATRQESIPLYRSTVIPAHAVFDSSNEGYASFPTSRWDGYVHVSSTDTWRFNINHRYAKHRLWLDGSLLIDGWTAWSSGATSSASRALAPGWHHFRMEAKEMCACNSAYVHLLRAPATGTFQTIPMTEMGREYWASAVPTTSSITVTAPNGGETIGSSEPLSLTWNAVGPDATRVDIWLSTDGGTTWPHLLARADANDGSYAWRVPTGMASTQARIRVVGESAGGIPITVDESDADFAIDTTGGSLSPVSDLQATATGPGEITVSWTMPAPLGGVDHVNVYRDPGDGSEPALVHSTADAVTSSWADTSAANGQRYRYYVRSADAAGLEARSWSAGGLDGSYFSDTALTIHEGSQPLTTAFDLTIPTEGPSLDETHGRTFTGGALGARWSGAINVATAGTYTFWMYARYEHRRLFVDGQPVVDRWGGGWAANDATAEVYLTPGWHTIRVDQATPPGDYIRTRVMWAMRGGSAVAVPAANLGREAFASAVANTSAVTVTAPNGGETWRNQGPRTITWTSSGGEIATVNLRLSLDGGSTWPHVIARRAPDSGSYDWYVPGGMDSTQARVRVEAVTTSGYVLASDSSNSNFAISAASGALAPVSNVGATATGPGELTVSWTMPAPLGAVDHVNVYREPAEGQEPVLVHSTSDTTTTSWVDTGLSNGSRYRYAVRTVDAAGAEARAYAAGGLEASYFSDLALATYEGRQVMSSAFDLTFSGDGPVIDDTHGRVFAGTAHGGRWTGAIYVATPDTYTFWSYTRYEYRRLFVDDRQLINGWGGGWAANDASASVYLTAGWHLLRYEQAAPVGEYLRTRLQWAPRGGAATAVAAASLGREVLADAVTTSTDVTLTAPNGAEHLRRQGLTTITWNTSGAEASHVTIRLSTNGGATYPHVVARRVTNTGSYQWFVPGGLATSQARIRVEGVTGSGWTVARDESDADFAITSDGAGLPPVQSVAVEPDGPGELRVTWQMPAPLGSVDRVRVYRVPPAEGEPALVHTSADATETSWTDTGLAIGQRFGYVVRTVDAAGNESRSYQAGSLGFAAYRDNAYGSFNHAGTQTGAFDLTFSDYGAISPTAPGTNCSGCAMRWSGAIYVPTADTWSFYMYTRYAYRRLWIDEEQVVNDWGGGWAANDARATRYLTAGWHNVRVEQAAPAGDTIRARLMWATRGNPAVGIPGASFGVERAAYGVPTSTIVTLDAPNGGETWTGNVQRTISWTSVGAPPGSTARIGYSTDGGVTWPYTVAGDIAGGTYSFKPPESLVSANVRFFVEIVGPEGLVRARDESDANLSVDATTTNTAVSNVLATPGWRQVALSWTNPTDPDFDHVNVYRSTTPTTLGPKVATVAAPAGSWTDTGLTNGQGYHYTLRAANSADVERLSIQSGGLRGYYYSDNGFGTLAATQVDPTVSFDWGWGGGPAALGGQADNFSIRWVGYVHSSTISDWVFDGSPTRDAIRVEVNGQRVVDSWNVCDCDANRSGHQQLTVGWHPVSVEYMETGGYARVYLYRHSATAARTIVPAGSLGTERTIAAVPNDITAPSPNPVGTAVADSPTQITWNAIGATDTESGLHATAFSYDNGSTWINQVAWPRTGLTPNTSYTQTVRVRDAAGNATVPQVVTRRTLAVDPSVSSSHATGTWLGPGATSITFSNLAAFGAGGVEHYRWVFNQNSAHTFDGSEPQWSTGNLVRTISSSGDWYLHVRSYNADGVGGATVSYGPYRIDATAPTPNPPTVAWSSTLTDVNFSIGAVTDAESGVATNAYSWDGGTTWGSSTTSSSTGLPPNTTATRSVRVRDVVGNVSGIVTATGATLPVDPNVTVSPAAGATWRAGNTTFTMTSAAAFAPGSLSSYRYRLTTNATDAVTNADPSWTSGTQAVSIGPTGVWYLRVRSYNAVGDGGNTITLGPLNVDASAPPATTASAPSPTSGAPVVSWTSVVDGESGVAGYRVYRSTIGGAIGSLLTTTPAATTSWTDPDTLVDDTTYYYTVQAIDQAGNEQVVGNAQVAVVYASAPPSGSSVTIAGGTAAVAAPTVTLTLSSTNAADMQLSNAPDFSGATWEPYATSAGWTLPAGSGTKTVYARFRNAGGTVSSSVADTILLDADAPQPDPPGVVAVANSATQVTWTSDPVSDAGAGLPAAPYSFDDGNAWQAGVGFVRTSLSPNTSYTALVRARDALGNVTAQRAVSSTTLAAAPAISSTPLPDPGEQPRGTTFTFTNLAGWGAGGVEYYRWRWDTATTHSFAGTEPMWTSGTHSVQELTAGTFYLHVQAFNADDQPGSTLDYGPFTVAAPQTPADLTVNIADTQTISCSTTDFATALLPGSQDDATVACTVTSAVAGWNLQARASAAPFFTDFVDMAATPAAYAAPAAGDAHVGFTMTGAKSDAAFSSGSLWRGFAGASDIRIAGDAGTSSGDTVTMRVRAHLGSSSGTTAGNRTGTITYTLNPGA